MKCPKCQFDNREEAMFCKECGAKFELTCPECSARYFPPSKFCDECGYDLSRPTKAPKDDFSSPESYTAEQLASKTPATRSSIDGERKHVTALFSDLMGYTAMSERLDPEEMKDITTNIFDKISKIVSNYDGFIEKYAGDAVMALFGAKEAHEDDPVRAIKAAREIHNLVNNLSPKYEGKTEQPLSMHTGINTGLVVTGDINLEKGTHGVSGDTINVAARLSGLGKTDDILVGQNTFYQAEGFFDFKELEPAIIKGKTEPIKAYKVLSPKEKPIKIHRLHGLRANLIGRKVEMIQLESALRRLAEDKKGSIVTICGPAGTGKSRLVEEFRSSLKVENIQWLEGHAYPYSQNMPYYPIIDLLNKALEIDEGDSSETIREKIQTGISGLLGEKTNLIPYIGSLFSITYPEIEDVSPEFWKKQLKEAFQSILASLSHGGPMIICFEDLHWADPSFLELIRTILPEFRNPILFLCSHRPVISLYTSHQIDSMSVPYHEIRLQDLSPSESQVMVESLLMTDSIPSELQRFVQDKIEGNPFYIEEVINSLIESETLIKENDSWQVERQIVESDISSSIHGVISGRLDRLENDTKRILQEASVIGRSFLYEILKRITELKDQIDSCLSGLERLDLIKTRTVQPDFEYIFKHALTQEVVYNGLLKKNRQAIHEKIALVMEQLFQDRLSEFYETLAFHFKQGQSVSKAVDYLIKSAEKCLRRYALEESHLYFKQAFDILSEQQTEMKEKEELIIDLILGWASVYHHLGDFIGLIDLFRAHEKLTERLNDKEKQGMFNAWLGHGLQNRLKLNEGHKYLLKALKLGEDIENRKVVGHSCSMLSIICSELGFLEEAVAFGKKSEEISKDFPADRELVRHSFLGLGLAYFFKGERTKVYKVGKDLLAYGHSHYDLQSDSMGYQLIGISYLIAGDFPKAIERFKKAIEFSEAPYFSQSLRILLGFSYISSGQMEAAENTLEEVMRPGMNFGDETIETLAYVLMGIVSIAKGELSRGVRLIEAQIHLFFESGSRYRYATVNFLLGKIYLRIIQGTRPMSLSFLANNLGFLVKNVPFASKRAENHFNNAIEVAKDIGAKSIRAQANLDLGILHNSKGGTIHARECFKEAIQLFEQCEAEIYLRQAKEALASLG
jgi:class 3 adenylate cyclase/tetratricopeptide (TPR) repeat protein